MKITDVTLTLFAWDNIPATTYGRHTGKFGGQSQLGLLTLRTDEGAEMSSQQVADGVLVFGSRQSPDRVGATRIRPLRLRPRGLARISPTGCRAPRRAP